MGQQMQRRKLSQGLYGNGAKPNIINNDLSKETTCDSSDENMTMSGSKPNEDLQVGKSTTPVKSIRKCGGKIIKKLTEEELNLKFIERDPPTESNSEALTPPPSPSSANTPVIHGNLPETAVVVGFIRDGEMHFLVTNKPLGEKQKGEKQMEDDNLKGKTGKIVKKKLKNK